MTHEPLHDDDDDEAACRERISALMDGELSGAALDRACGHWREAAGSRASWHAYHLIGDVLRSDDLAGGAERGAVFLQALRVRLVDEPVVFAPGRPIAPEPIVAAPAVASASAANGWIVPRSTAGRAWLGWRGSATFAAGVLAAAGVAVMVRSPMLSGFGLPASADTTVATSSSDRVPKGLIGAMPTSTTPVASENAAVGAAPRQLAPSDPLIRDARLDRYLEAHKQFAGSSALGVPSGFLRAATAERIER